MNRQNDFALSYISRMIIVQTVYGDSDTVSFEKKEEAALSQYADFRKFDSCPFKKTTFP